MCLVIINCLITNANAKKDDLPDANDFIYSEYEVNLVNEIESNFYNAKNKIEFLVNFQYDFKLHKDKMYSIYLLNILRKSLSKSNPYIMNNKKVLEFISKYENTNFYTDEAIWKKIIVWIFLRPGKFEVTKISSEEFFSYMIRRRQILENIIKNNNDYAPIALYLLRITEGDQIGIEPSKEILEKKIKELKNIIEKYPDSEFAPFTLIEISRVYFNDKEFEKAKENYLKIIKNYKNIFIGNGDLYSGVYSELLHICEILKDNDNLKKYFNKINKKIKKYEQLKYIYRQYL